MLRAGLDISADAIRVCVVAMDDPPQWRASAVEELPAGAVVDGTVRDGPVVVAAIQRAMEELEVDVVTVGYRGDDALTKSITLPLMTEAELAEQISWEAEQHVPFDVKTTALEYRITGEDREHGQMAVRLTAIRNERVDGIVALTKQAGIEVRAVELLEEALLRVRRLDASSAEPHAIVGALADVTVTVVTQAGELVFARTGDVRQVLDYGSAALDVDVAGVTVLGSRARAVAGRLGETLEVPVSVWAPVHPGLKPVSAELAPALGLALPGPSMTRVGGPKRRGLWARLFG